MKAVTKISPAILLVSAVVILSIALGGCSTLFKGTRQEISVNSTPPGASVFVNNVSFGQTPTVIDLKRNKQYTVLIELNGYKPYELTFDRKWNTTFYINIPVIGWVVDALSGAMYKLTPQEVQAMLESQGTPAPAADSTQPTMPMYPPQPDSANAQPGGDATVTPQEVIPETIPADTTEAEDDDETESDDGSGGQLEASIVDGTLYLFVVMEADPNWVKVGQLERVIK